MKFILRSVIAFTLLFSAPVDAACRGSDLLTNAPASFQQSVNRRASKHAFPTGRYWQITKGGKTSWIIGTIHTSDRRTSKVPKFFRTKIKTARVVMKEITRSQRGQYRAEFNRRAPLAVENLQDDNEKLFTPAEWLALMEEARSKNIPLDYFRYLTLSYIIGQIGGAPCNRRTDDYLDANVEKAAIRARVPVIGLDSPVKLVDMDLSSSYDDRTALAIIKAEIPKLDSRRHQIETVVQIYLRGETAKFTAFYSTYLRTYLPESIARKIERNRQVRLLDDRNKFWMGKLVPQMTAGNAVVAFGAGHLSGQYGILNLLKRRGFTVTPLSL